MSQVKQKKRSLKSSPSEYVSILKRWFRGSDVILVARLTSLSGFITAVIGSLDWSPLLGMSGLDRKQIIISGVVIILIGISHEVARRVNHV